MGDSLTAGVQAGGLTAASQRAAYPVQAARLLGLPFAPPLTRAPCPTPLSMGDVGGALPVGACQRLYQSAPPSNPATTNIAVAGARPTPHHRRQCPQ